jgi:parallel beta-helix repeat protein
LICFLSFIVGLMGHSAFAEPIRSNGKGGGAWSAATTWQGGKVPAGEPVAILGKDVVDLDTNAACEELVVDPQGALRVVGKSKTMLTLTLRKALRVFGGVMVDFSKDREGRFECVWTNAEASGFEFLLSDGCKLIGKGASGTTGAPPNVVFRIATNALPAGATVPKPIPLTLGTKMLVECENVVLEGFEIQATGMDGSGLKFNERCSFRGCHFIRSPVTFQYCKKIEFEGNVSSDSPAHGVYLYGASNSRITSNLFLRCAPSTAGISSYGSTDCELADNTVRSCYYGMNFVACSEIIFSKNRYEQNLYGLFLNSCSRITGQSCLFDSNTVSHLHATFASPVEYRFFDCVFQNTPTNVNCASIGVDGTVLVDIVNSPFQTYQKDGARGPLTFSAYVDVFVTNEQGEPLGRVPLRVLSGAKVAATSRTEAVGARTGYTPLPSTHRPLVVPWFRFAPSEGLTNPAKSLSYQLEADGTTLGYTKQTVPLVVDETFVRPDPNKPTKTITIKLAKAK